MRKQEPKTSTQHKELYKIEVLNQVYVCWGDKKNKGFSM
jgi:hypothetical protein